MLAGVHMHALLVQQARATSVHAWRSHDQCAFFFLQASFMGTPQFTYEVTALGGNPYLLPGEPRGCCCGAGGGRRRAGAGTVRRACMHAQHGAERVAAPPLPGLRTAGVEWLVSSFIKENILRPLTFPDGGPPRAQASTLPASACSGAVLGCDSAHSPWAGAGLSGTCTACRRLHVRPGHPQRHGLRATRGAAGGGRGAGLLQQTGT